MSFDPLDPQYQVSKDFPPDKDVTWTFPKEQDAWMFAHNSLRKEMAGLKAALAAIQKRGGIKEEWEVKALQDATAVHFENVHAHHSNEDNILTPFIMTRAKYPDKVSTHTVTVVRLDSCKHLHLLNLRCPTAHIGS
jgi:hypothetical protein